MSSPRFGSFFEETLPRGPLDPSPTDRDASRIETGQSEKFELGSAWMKIRRALRDRRHASLLEAAKRGDEDAFVRLYRELYDPIARYAEARVRPLEDAQDLTSTIFHRFLGRIDQYQRRRGSVLSWLLTITHHAVVDHHRARRPKASLDEIPEALTGREPRALERLLQGEERERVRELVAGLPSATRLMFELRFDQGLRYREIARILGVGEAAVKQRFSRTLRRLAKEWSDEE